ncbi:MAG TPA: hypothetical protein VHS34_15435 [Terriglobales bacterium]|jgi:hypothetical protein|nr:hypothetical protein [Terriglobales bacterium]
MKKGMALALSLALATGAFAAPAPQSSAGAAKTTTKKKTASATNAEILRRLEEMQQALSVQQQQIQQLRDQVQTRDTVIQQLQQQSSQAQTTAGQAEQKADTALSQTTAQQQVVATTHADVTDIKDTLNNTAQALQETQKSISESPLAIRFKGITLTPGGFMAAETVWRQHALGSDINTPFNSITMPGAAGDKMSEFFGSGRQSRISLLGEGKLSMAKLTGYVEADFLSAGVTSNNNESNSYSLRQRQVWGQAALTDGFTFTGGQMWSLVTETRKGLDNRTEALPMTIDPQYHVGFSWARQYGFRVTKNFGNKFWLGASVENPQVLFASSGQAQNFVIGSAGTGGGLYNASATYSFNSAPDFVFKAAAEPGFGHFEIFGVVRRFRDRIYPNATAATPSAVGATNFDTTTGGIGANARVSFFKKHVDLAGHFLGGDGMGRYGTSTLPDVTVNPDGTLAPLRAYQGLGTLEFHTTKWDIYLNGGGEFVGRHALLNAGGKPVGYGSDLANNSGCGIETVPGTPVGGQFPTSSSGFLPGGLANCAANTRNIIEGTFGFWYRFYKGPKGTIQWGPQYSYLVRNTWSGAAGATKLGQPSGIENMFLTSFRYYLP